MHANACFQSNTASNSDIEIEHCLNTEENSVKFVFLHKIKSRRRAAVAAKRLETIEDQSIHIYA